MSNLNIDKLKEKYPKMPQDIKDTVLETVNSELSKKSAPKQPYLKVAGIGLAILLGIGGTCYAASKLARLNVEKVGEYGADISVVTEASSTDENTGNNDEAVESSNIVVDFSNLPDGYVTFEGFVDNIMECGKAIITHPGYCLDDENVSVYVFSLIDGYESFKVQDTYVNTTENFNVKNGTAIYLEYTFAESADLQISSKIYMIYPEENILIELCGFNGISKDDMYSIANSLILTTDTDIYSTITEPLILSKDDVPSFVYNDECISSTYAPEYIEFIQKYSKISVEEFEQSLNQIGEEIYFDYHYNSPKEKGDQNTVGMKVSDVQVLDNISSVDPSGFHTDISLFTDENGNLVDETLQYIKNGDGINTVQEIVKTETKKMKFVLVSIDVTSYTAGTIRDYCYSPGTLILARQEGDMLQIYNNNICLEEGIDQIVGVHYRDSGSIAYYYNGVDASEKNNIINLPEGETRTVYSGFFVAEEDLPNMYLELIWSNEDNNVFGYNKNEISLPLQNKGFFDIRQ